METRARGVHRTALPALRSNTFVRVLIAGALLALVGVGAKYAYGSGDDPDPLGVELAGTHGEAGAVLADGGASFLRPISLSAENKVPCPLGTATGMAMTGDCAQHAKEARDALGRDLWFIAAYAFMGVAGCLLGASVLRPGQGRRLLEAAAWAAGIAAVADLIEDRLLWSALDPNSTSETWQRAAAVAATFKWSLLPVFFIGALIGLWLFVRRLPPPPEGKKTPGGDHPTLACALRWQEPEKGCWDQGQRGICFSGGGIRSPSFSLGALQGLEEANQGSALARARYLTAVSGGGYLAGAAQLLASRREQAEHEYRAFGTGSPEEDHLRRHANYLADGAGEWVNALGQAIGKVLGNLVLVGLFLLSIAQPVGWIGRVLLDARPAAVSPGENLPNFPQAVGFALLLLSVPAVLMAASHRRDTTTIKSFSSLVSVASARCAVAPLRWVSGRRCSASPPSRFRCSMSSG